MKRQAMEPELAPEWRTTTWLNSPEPLTLERLRGRVILLHAFQMLCPGCVARSIPQAKRAAELFRGEPLSVIGLHTVFEHHEAMRVESLRAFVHEYRVGFPVGVDAPSLDGRPIPQTMSAYQMRGTPTTVLIDARGRLRSQTFGGHEDMRLGADIEALLAEARADAASVDPANVATQAEGCDGDVCATNAPT